jgi:hypothetical protein
MDFVGDGEYIFQCIFNWQDEEVKNWTLEKWLIILRIQHTSLGEKCKTMDTASETQYLCVAAGASLSKGTRRIIPTGSHNDTDGP